MHPAGIRDAARLGSLGVRGLNNTTSVPKLFRLDPFRFLNDALHTNGRMREFVREHLQLIMVLLSLNTDNNWMDH